MTTVDTHDNHAASTAGHEAHADGHADHGDGIYIKVAIFLAAMTALEVGISYLSVSGPWKTIGLFVLMILKFLTVTSFFMHLKWDHKWFSYLFYTGLVLSIAVYAAMLTCFQLWAK
jgi:cytochrome c oxidase subunit IV